MSHRASTRVRLDLFDATKGLTRGRGVLVETLWYALKCAFFTTILPWPSALKVSILRLFGAKMGSGVVIKPRVNIHLPWKLTVGDHCWLGEGAWILNLEEISIGAHVCVSQNAFLCTGNHDFRNPGMPYRNAPIAIEDGAWIAAQTFIGPGVSIGREAVVLAGSVVLKSLEGGNVYQGSPCVMTGSRWARQAPQ
jgi:putative colanic acid biosynthesis acetyltransferase WcaF